MQAQPGCAITVPSRVSRDLQEAAKDAGVRLHDVRATGQLLMKLERDHAKMSEQKVSLSQELVEMSERAKAAETAREALALQLSVAHAERKFVDEKLARLERDVHEDRDKRDALAERLSKAELCIETKHEEIKKLHAQHREQTDALQERLAAAAAERATLQERLGIATAERATLQERLAVATAERNLLDDLAQRRLAEMDLIRLDASKHVAMAEARAMEALAVKSAAEHECSRTQRDLAAATCEKTTLHELSTILNHRLESELATWKATEAALRAELKAAEAKAAEMAYTSKEEALSLQTDLEVQRVRTDVRVAHLTAQLELLQKDYAMLAPSRARLEPKVRNLLNLPEGAPEMTISRAGDGISPTRPLPLVATLPVSLVPKSAVVSAHVVSSPPFGSPASSGSPFVNMPTTALSPRASSGSPAAYAPIGQYAHDSAVPKGLWGNREPPLRSAAPVTLTPNSSDGSPDAYGGKRRAWPPPSGAWPWPDSIT